MSRPIKERKSDGVDSRIEDKRVPLGVIHSKLTLPPGMVPSTHHAHWINDKGNRINMALSGGYSFVENDGRYHVGGGYADGNSDIGGKISRVTGKAEDGSPMRSYLMMIPLEMYEADQATKQKPIDMTEGAIQSGGFKSHGLEGKGYGNIEVGGSRSSFNQYQP